MSFAWQWERKKHFWIFDYIFALYSCGCVSKWCDKREFSFPFFNLMSKLNFTISHQKDRNVDDERKAFKSYFSFWKCHEIIVHGKRRECSNWDVVEKKWFISIHMRAFLWTLQLILHQLSWNICQITHYVIFWNCLRKFWVFINKFALFSHYGT